MLLRINNLLSYARYMPCDIMGYPLSAVWDPRAKRAALVQQNKMGISGPINGPYPAWGAHRSQVRYSRDLLVRPTSQV